MDGFKDSTKMKYMGGGMVGGYAKGGMAKGAAKIAKVMGEFKKGELHSGSKEGPKVTKPAQAKAIAMSEARKAGMKAPMKKNEGGKVGKMPPLGESVKSGNRMAEEEGAEMRAMKARFGEKKRPSPADSVKSGNRIAKEEADEARAMGVLKDGGKVRKYAVGGAVAPARAAFNPTQALNQFGADLARRVKAGTMTAAQARQAQSQFRNQVQLNTKAPPTRQGAEGIARDIMKSVMAPPMPPSRDLRQLQALQAKQKAAQTPLPAQPVMPTPEIPNMGLIDNRIGPGFGKPMQPQNPPGLGAISSGLRDFIAKQPPMSAGVGGMPSSGGYAGTNMTKGQVRNIGRYGSADPFGATTSINSGAPTPQAPAAMPGAPQTDPRFRMGGMAKRRPC